jgi:COP9 signalosome complex subunit 5
MARFEVENNIAPVDGQDAIFRYDAAAQRATDQAKPWRENPQYFKQCVHETLSALCLLASPTRLLIRLLSPARRSVRVSALALVKMTMHCRSGGNLEARARTLALVPSHLTPPRRLR